MDHEQELQEAQGRGYEPLDTASVLGVAAPYLPGPPEVAEEIGDGNLNQVFRVRGGGSSVIVKQALPYLRVVGDGWPLTLDRARIEAEALALQQRLAPGRVPTLLHFCDRRFALVMEDLSDHVVLRHGMIAGQSFPDAFRHLGEFAARTLLGTSDLLLGAAERKQLFVRFVNPDLCAITEDLVFTSPFIDSPSNHEDPALAPIMSRLQGDRAVRREAARLRFIFRTRAEAIVHGDLHTGSVMASESDTKVIDPEFAFPGPMAFDTGKVLGNLALAFLGHTAQGHDDYARTITRWAADFWTSFADEVRRLWPAGEPWREAFVAELLADSARFAGAVMCRRTVGLAGVADIRGIDDADQRFRAQSDSVAGGVALLTARTVGSLDDLWGLATEAQAYSPC